MKKYEAMFIVKPDLSEEDRKTLFNQINDIIVKNKGNLTQSGIWLERRKLYFAIKRFQEGTYYLANFALDPAAISEINRAYKLNEHILRVLITKKED